MGRQEPCWWGGQISSSPPLSLISTATLFYILYMRGTEMLCKLDKVTQPGCSGTGIQVTLFFFNIAVIWVKITADGDCIHEIKRCLLLGRKAMTNPDSVLKSRAITLLTKVHIVKVMVFPVVIYGCENWTTEKAESQRADAFELWCWRRL